MRSLSGGLAALAIAGFPVSPAPQPQPPGAAEKAPRQDVRRSDPACVGPLDAPALKLRLPGGELKLGVLAGLKDPDDENLAHLRGLALELQRRGADLLVAAGDVGDTSEAQGALLGALAAAGLPLVVVPGNRELRSDLDAAEAELRRRGGRITDLSHNRVADLGDALLVGLPGAFERRQLRVEGACMYVSQDVDALAAWLDRLPPGGLPVILVAAVPPRGADASALDVSEGQNLGDPRLGALLSPQRAAFGLFGQVWEAGGRALDGGGRPVPPAMPSLQLYLNPGAADRTPWPMSDGTTAAGLAALVTLRGRQASWEPIRAAARPAPAAPRQP